MKVKPAMENRVKGQKRTKDNICWCCNGPDATRPCAYWVNGQVRPLCAECERTQAVVKPAPRVRG